MPIESLMMPHQALFLFAGTGMAVFNILKILID